MKKIALMIVCLLAMMAASMSASAQEVTITLTPGWTWISSPSTEAVDFAAALGDFVPMEGDIIRSQWGQATYTNGRWRGGVSQFYPGYGYKYKSNRQVPVIVTFNAQQPTQQVVVITSEPTDITTNSATSGGSITTDAYVFAKGICWAAHSDPTPMDDDHSESGGGDESFTAEMTELSQNTMYYVRAYVVTQDGIAYGNEVSFSTIPIWTIEATPNPTEGGTITGAGDYEQNAICNLTALANEGYIFANWTENGEVVSTDATYTFTVDAARTLVANFDLDHTYVDLGLPSGTLWATCNLGANLPEEYGDYFAWGETQPKDNFSWTNYQYCMGSFNTLTKYCNNPDIGYNGFTDNLTTLEPSDDAATANWGDDWRMPTEEEWQELYQNTTVTWTTRNGVNGRLFTASNGNSLFMPASGYCNESTPEAAGIIGDYWTSSLDTDYPSGALSFFFNSSNYYIGFCNRLYGRNVRAVRPSQNHAYVDLGLPSGLLWANCNVGADNPEDYGDYFAWGETQPKDTYNWSTYQYCNGDYNLLTKYCTDASYGYNGFTDNLTTLRPDDDAATTNWGNGWRMPTEAEWQELLDNTTITWTQQNGVNGRLFTASNGNSLFLPAAGYRWDGELNYAGDFSIYWSSSLDTDSPRSAGSLFSTYVDHIIRGYGFSVRPVLQITSFVIEATANPTEGGTVTGGSTYQVGQSCTVTATANTGYSFASWTENGAVVSTDATYSFTVEADRTLVANFVVSSGGDHAYVDLGLPSGLLWATCNVGAENPEDYGDYFAWGETQPKNDYSWSTYQYCNGDEYSLTKYCNNSEFGYNGFTDNLTTLLPEDDAATANWGSDWRMPTKEEWQELLDNTTVTWTTINGVNGRLFTASNGGSLFLPAEGYIDGINLKEEGSFGFYWSCSLYHDSSYAYRLRFQSDNFNVSGSWRCYGHSVRAVRSALQN